MVVQNKLYRVINKYRELLKERSIKSKIRKIKGTILNGNKTKNRVLDFYLKNHRWPSRLSNNKKEKALGTRFENFVSKQCASYDSVFRRIVMASGRTTNNKRKHNVSEFKRDILAFVQEHKRVPCVHEEFEKVKGESKLRSRLDYYTKEKNDMTLLGKVYEIDKCHLSHIPSKYRSLINEHLDIEKPLIRLVK